MGTNRHLVGADAHHAGNVCGAVHVWRGAPGARPARASAATQTAGCSSCASRTGGTVNNVQRLVGEARVRIAAGRAATWAARGLAIGAGAALLVEVFVRIIPIDPFAPALIGCGVLGLVVAAGGWARAWPTSTEVA